MARINIEDSLFKDQRFTDLCIKLGSRTAALGAFVEACMLAQEHYLTTDNDRLIPLNEWNRNRTLEHVLEVGLAEKREKGIYVSGSNEQFKWLIQRSNAGKKLKGSRKKRPKSVDKRDETKVNGSNPLTPTLSLSLTPSLPAKVPDSKIESADLAKKIWESYSTAYQGRYGVPPVRNAKVNSQIRQLGERLGEEAPLVAAFYITSNKTFYASKVHEIGLCLADAESLRTQWAKGKAITNADLKRFEKNVESNNLDRLINEGKI